MISNPCNCFSKLFLLKFDQFYYYFKMSAHRKTIHEHPSTSSATARRWACSAVIFVEINLFRVLTNQHSHKI